MAPFFSSIPDYGLNTDDVSYLNLESQVRGRGPERLKYLDLEGRWLLSGKSIPYISTAFNHLEHINDSRFPFRDVVDEPINAIGMVGWSPSSVPASGYDYYEKSERRAPSKVKLPVPVVVEDELPPSPREKVPHRSAGYGPAHQKRKLSIPDRSRSASPNRIDSSIPTYDRYAKYERNRTDSVTRYGTKWGTTETRTGTPSEKESGNSRLPHRTPAFSPRPPSSITSMIRDTTSIYTGKRDVPYKEELRVVTREQKQGYVPYRSGGYGPYHEKRQYELSPRSLGSAADYTSGSEQSSPASMYERNPDEIVLMEYHSRRTTGTSPRRERTAWVH